MIQLIAGSAPALMSFRMFVFGLEILVFHSGPLNTGLIARKPTQLNPASWAFGAYIFHDSCFASSSEAMVGSVQQAFSSGPIVRVAVIVATLDGQPQTPCGRATACCACAAIRYWCPTKLASTCDWKLLSASTYSPASWKYS